MAKQKELEGNNYDRQTGEQRNNRKKKIRSLLIKTTIKKISIPSHTSLHLLTFLPSFYSCLALFSLSFLPVVIPYLLPSNLANFE